MQPLDPFCNILFFISMIFRAHLSRGFKLLFGENDLVQKLKFAADFPPFNHSTAFVLCESIFFFLLLSYKRNLFCTVIVLFLYIPSIQSRFSIQLIDIPENFLNIFLGQKNAVQGFIHTSQKRSHFGINQPTFSGKISPEKDCLANYTFFQDSTKNGN